MTCWASARVFQLPDRRRLFSYLRRLRRILLDHGPYDVVHSHYHVFSGLVLAAARKAGVPIRIAHAQTTSDPEARSRLAARLAQLLGRRLLRRHATVWMACSLQAASALFGPDSYDQFATRILVLPGGSAGNPFKEIIRTTRCERS
jgi:hypothetical protein